MTDDRKLIEEARKLARFAPNASATYAVIMRDAEMMDRLADALETAREQKEAADNLRDAASQAATFAYMRAEALEAERDRLKGALNDVWARAKTMRKSRKLMGPREYEDKPAFMRVWCKTLEKEGKELAKVCRDTLQPNAAPTPSGAPVDPNICFACGCWSSEETVRTCGYAECPFARPTLEGEE